MIDAPHARSVARHRDRDPPVADAVLEHLAVFARERDIERDVVSATRIRRRVVRGVFEVRLRACLELAISFQ
jgi:hypothetical protein